MPEFHFVLSTIIISVLSVALSLDRRHAQHDRGRSLLPSSQGGNLHNSFPTPSASILMLSYFGKLSQTLLAIFIYTFQRHCGSQTLSTESLVFPPIELLSSPALDLDTQKVSLPGMLEFPSEHQQVNTMATAPQPAACEAGTDDINISPLRRKQPTFVEPNLAKPPPNIKPLAKTVTFMPSQVGNPDQVSISYTATPLRLMWYDLQLVLGKLPSTMGIMRPWRMGKEADPFDEMYPSGRNLLSIAIHAVLVVTQLVSRLPSLPLLIVVMWE